MPILDQESLTAFSGMVEELTSRLKEKDLLKMKKSISDLGSEITKFASQKFVEKMQRTPTQVAKSQELGLQKALQARATLMGQLKSIEERMVAHREKGDKRGMESLRERYQLLRQQKSVYINIADAIGEAVDNEANLGQQQRLLGSIQQKILMTEQGIASARDPIEKNLYASQLKGLRVAEEMADRLVTQTKMEERQEQIQERMSKFLGVNFAEAKEQAIETASHFRDWMFYVGGTLAIVKHLTTEMIAFGHEAGTSFFQTAGQIGKTFHSLLTSIREGVLILPSEAAESVSDLINVFGRTDLVTQDIIAEQTKLTKVYGLSQDEASELLEVISDIDHYAPNMAKNFLLSANALSRANDVPIARTLHEASQNAELLVRMGERGAASFARAAVQSARLGVNLKAFDEFADKTLNVEDFLTGISRLRTFGINLADPMKLMALSNSNNIAGLQIELQKQLRSSGIGDISQLTRIQQNMIGQELGLSLDQIERMLGRPGTQLKPGASNAAEARKETTESLVTTGAELIDKLGTTNMLIKILIGVMAGGALFRGLAGVLGRIPLIGGLLGRVAGVGGAARGLLGGLGGAGEAAAAGGIGGGASLLGVGGMALLKKIGGSLIFKIGGTILALLPALFDVIKSVAHAHGFGNIAKEFGKALLRHKFTILAAIVGAFFPPLLPLLLGGGAILDATIGKKFLNPQAGTDVAPAASPINTEEQQTTSLTEPMGEQQMPIAQPPMMVDMGGVERKLDELITMFRNGSIAVNIDGRKAGSLIQGAQPTSNYERAR